MGVVAFQPGVAKTLTRYLSERNWSAVLDALRNGAPAHAKMADSPLTLFEGVFRSIAAYMRNPLTDLEAHRRETHAQVEVFRALASAPWVFDERRPTPLSAATLLGRRDLVDILLEAGHDPCAVGEGGNPAIAVSQVFLPKNASVELLCSQAENGWDDLSGLDRRTCLKRLARAGLDLSAPAFRGTTALHLACGAKDTPLILFLLAQGVSPDVLARDATGWLEWSPLEISVVFKNENAVSALLKAGADPLQRSLSNRPASPSLAALVGACGQAGMLQAMALCLGDVRHPALLEAAHLARIHGNEEALAWFGRHGYESLSATATSADSKVIPFPGARRR